MSGPVISAAPGVDPALVDRRSQRLPAVHESDLPVRLMSIAGLEGRMEAHILSKDFSGPATRLALIPAGYGSGVAGAFTADLELFVIRGSLQAGGEELGDNDYLAVRAGQIISGLRAESETLALVMTSAPIRYDTAAGGGLSAPLVGRGGEGAWEEVEQLPGCFVLPLAEGPAGPVFLGAAREWSNTEGPWHSHEAPEEMFVLQGSLTLTERHGNEVVTEHFLPGSYIFRLPERLHAGPGSQAPDSSLAFHRTLGPRATHWTVGDAGLPADAEPGLVDGRPD